MTNEETCIIKVLKPVSKKKIKREIKILRNLTGGPNVISLLNVVHDPISRSNSLIMEYVSNVDWKDLYPTFTELEIKHYMFQLLKVGFNCAADNTAFLISPLFLPGVGLRSFARYHAPRCQAW